jgi:RNase P/RNase MRP subunit p30
LPLFENYTLNEEFKNYYNKQLEENGKLKVFSNIKMNFEMEKDLDDLYKINHSFIFFKLEDLFHYVMA